MIWSSVALGGVGYVLPFGKEHLRLLLYCSLELVPCNYCTLLDYLGCHGALALCFANPFTPVQIRYPRRSMFVDLSFCVKRVQRWTSLR
jgi:hypothetical protein